MLVSVQSRAQAERRRRAAPRNGDVVLYFGDDERVQHAGQIIDASCRIRSKWGQAEVHEHGLWEVPLMHRRTAPCPAHYKTWLPWWTFARSDAVILPRGTPVEITFALLPVGWVFKAGDRVRLAVASGDRDHIVQVPHGRPPGLRIHHGIAHPSRLVLPVRSGV
jgi:X-Pro dipeptidyl-peptidase C-terminal non-catalytic domain